MAIAAIRMIPSPHDYGIRFAHLTDLARIIQAKKQMIFHQSEPLPQILLQGM
jgi:hypothetical protein